MSAPTLERIINRLAARFERAGLAFGHDADGAWEEAALISLWSIGESLENISPGSGHFNWHRKLTANQIKVIEQQAGRRIDTRKPFAYLVNETWFAGKKFYIDERAIIPRSYLSEWIPQRFEPWITADRVRNILDLCTGCGCIAITAAMAFDHAQVTASDISTQALELASINVENYQLTGRIELSQSDLFEGIDQKFDLILCNPPYVSKERMNRLPPEYRFEPELAFAAGDDGLEIINRLLLQARNYLNNEGVLVVEAGSASAALEERFPRIAFTWLSTTHDEMVVFLITAAELDQYRGKLVSGT